MPGDETPQVAALGSIAGRAVREAEKAVARAAGVDIRLDRVVGSLGEVKQMVSALTRHVTKLVDAEQPEQPVPPVFSWMLADDRDATLAALIDLAEWLERVYFRYPNTRLSSCWAWHPAVVTELLILRQLHRDAEHGKSADKAAEWHDRWFPGVRDRVHKDAGNCELDLHRSGKRQGQPAVVTPMAQHLGAVVDAWVSTGRPPEPTPEQLRDALEHDSRRSGQVSRDVSA